MWEDNQFLLSVLNHFFDPQYGGGVGSGLDVPLFVGFKSVDWMVADIDLAKISTTNTPAQVPEFSLRNANDYFYHGLVDDTVSRREVAFGRLFQSLGHVVHHVQDMAQPQHTREAWHAHVGDIYFGPAVFPFYERYTEKYLNKRIETRSDAKLEAAITAYPTPMLPTSRQYWYVPGAALGSASSFIGMAGFTAQNFFTVNNELKVKDGKFVPSDGFPRPSGRNFDGSEMRVVSQDVSYMLRDDRVVSGKTNFLVGKVYDGFTAKLSDELRLAHAGFFWNPLANLNQTPRYNGFFESSLVFDDVHSVVAPRAIGFSAGLLNHFFRIDLNLVRADSKKATEWRLINNGPDELEGAFEFLYENGSGVRASSNSGQRTPNYTMTKVAPNGGVLAVTIPEPDSSISKLVVVFRGRAGAEGRAAVPAIQEWDYNLTGGRVVDFERLPTPNIVLNQTSVSLPALGTPSAVNISLSSSPVASTNVTVTRSSGSSFLSASPTSLTFTKDNYATPQSVSFSGTPNPSTAQAATFGLSGAGLASPANVSVNQAAAPPPPSCVSTYGVGGDNQGLNIIRDLGTDDGEVEVQFETYGVSDKVSIKYEGGDNSTLLGTDWVWGYNIYHFQFKHGKSRNVRIRVDGNPNESTLWELRVGCPGRGIDSNIPRRNVSFRVRNQVNCGLQWQVTLDGVGTAYKIPINGEIKIPVSIGRAHFLNITYVGAPGATCGGVTHAEIGDLTIDGDENKRFSGWWYSPIWFDLLK